MLYEKKMLILSGEGKGVVLIEKSAKGLRFSLSTFDMPICGELKAGVITPSAVFVRDLPQRDNPSAVFIVDADSASDIHFAVFDTKLRLYGTNGKRRWEANIMELLCKNDRKLPKDDVPQLAPLPPISTPPPVLPLPDGTGLPQSRLSIYGDDQIAESDFYTPIDLSARMPVVDRFLDEPRAIETSILDGLAPTVEKHFDPIAETTASADEIERKQSAESEDNSGADEDAQPEPQHISEAEAAAESEQSEQSESSPTAKSAVDREQSETVLAVDCGRRPCEMEARWLKTRSTRVVKNGQTTSVKPISNKPQVKPIREISFIERAATDIDKLFSNAEADEKLATLLPEIQWVKVPVDGHVISVGRGGTDFLCYAVSGTYEKTSPLGDEAQWLPENKNIPTGKGYWLIFQSLKDGEIITN